MKNLKLLLLSLSALLLFSACTNNDPIQARRDLLGPGDYGRVLALRLASEASDTSIGKVANAGRGFYLVAGNLKGTQSRFLMRFGGLAGLGAVRTAQLALPIHLLTGAGTDFSPTVHRVTGNWQEDSVTAANFNSQFDPATVGTRVSVALDSLRKNADKDTLWFNVDSTLVQAWIADSTNNFGLLVDSPAPDLLVEYHSRHGVSKAARLKLVLTQSTGRDTTRFFAPNADASIFSRTITLPEDHFYLGNGEQFQTYLAFAPLDTIPANATVNYAELQLSIDSTLTLNTSDGFTFAVDTVLAISDSNATRSYKIGILPITLGAVAATDRTLTLDLTTLTQSWLLLPDKNRGILLQGANPTRNVSRVAFFADRSRPELAPRLLIDYTLPPN